MGFEPFHYGVFQAIVAFKVLPGELYIDPVLQDVFILYKVRSIYSVTILVSDTYIGMTNLAIAWLLLR